MSEENDRERKRRNSEKKAKKFEKYSIDRTRFLSI